MEWLGFWLGIGFVLASWGIASGIENAVDAWVVWKREELESLRKK